MTNDNGPKKEKLMIFILDLTGLSGRNLRSMLNNLIEKLNRQDT